MIDRFGGTAKVSLLSGRDHAGSGAEVRRRSGGQAGKTAIRVFFDWPGRTEGKKANPKTVHAFVNANGAAIEKLGDELPPFIGWVELRPEGLSGTSRDDGLAFRIGGRRGLA